MIQIDDIRTVSGQKPLLQELRCQNDTAAAILFALLVNTALTGVQIKIFTGNLRVVDLSLAVDFFIATATAAFADLFPGLS